MTNNPIVPELIVMGAGPGDPELITVKGQRILQQADVVLYDNLANKELLNLTKADCDTIYVGKQPYGEYTTQEAIHEMIAHYAFTKGRVVRLKGGDPFIFGRGGEEAEILVENQIPFEIIPGITSGIGAANYSGIPLTHRKYGSTVAFVTGHEDPEKKTPEVKWDKLSEAVDTVVIYMGTEKLELIINKIKGGKIDDRTPIAIIQNSTLNNQKIITGNLGNIVSLAKEYNVKPPAVVIIGDIVNLHKKIKWYNQ